MDLKDFLTLLAILVALFGREFIIFLKRPSLEPTFIQEDTSYFHENLFPLFTHGGHRHFAKGRSCFLKISNPRRRRLFFLGSQTAKGCEAKVTYIFHDGKKFTYHPSWLIWSGVEREKPVSIMSGSHHFLHFLDIFNYEDELWIKDATFPNGVKKSAIHPSQAPAGCTLPEDRIYFELSASDHKAEIRNTFLNGGTYEIHFLLNGENCEPSEYMATLQWSRAEWDKPNLTIGEVKK
jgi:hypothetical protein